MPVRFGTEATKISSTLRRKKSNLKAFSKQARQEVLPNDRQVVKTDVPRCTLCVQSLITNVIDYDVARDRHLLITDNRDNFDKWKV